MTHDCQHSLWSSSAQQAASRLQVCVGASSVPGRSTSQFLHTMIESVERERLSARMKKPAVDSDIHIAGSRWVSVTHTAWQGKEDTASPVGR